MVACPWSSSHLSCGERLLLRCDGNAGNSFPTSQGKDPSSQERPVKIQGSTGEGETSQEAPELLAWLLAFPEATKAGP